VQGDAPAILVFARAAAAFDKAGEGKVHGGGLVAAHREELAHGSGELTMVPR
jgi:hypothetical protein